MAHHPNLLHHRIERLHQHYQNQYKIIANHKSDVEDLQNFYTNIQQLKYFLKNYQPYLGKQAKKLRGEVKHLSELLGEHLDDNRTHWLKEKQNNKQYSTDSSLGIEILLEYLPEGKKLKSKKIHSVAKKINKTLESLAKKVKFKKSFNTITAEMLTDYVQHLKSKLVQFKKDKSLTHQVRLSAMRLRYALELLESKDANSLVTSLQTLHDHLKDRDTLNHILKQIDVALKQEVKKWPRAFLEAIKTDVAPLEPKRVFALGSLRQDISKQIEYNHRILNEQWLSKSANVFFKDIASAIKMLKKTPDADMTEVTHNKKQDA